ncbi:MAG: hypothetical protein ACJ8CS_05745, partial [Microvirga sp.]
RSRCMNTSSNSDLTAARRPLKCRDNTTPLDLIVSGIPENWLAKLAWRERIAETAARLLA